MGKMNSKQWKLSTSLDSLTFSVLLEEPEMGFFYQDQEAMWLFLIIFTENIREIYFVKWVNIDIRIQIWEKKMLKQTSSEGKRGAKNNPDVRLSKHLIDSKVIKLNKLIC